MTAWWDWPFKFRMLDLRLTSGSKTQFKKLLENFLAKNTRLDSFTLPVAIDGWNRIIVLLVQTKTPQ